MPTNLPTYCRLGFRFTFDCALSRSSVTDGIITPLQHEACQHGHLSIVELLLQAGALVNAPSHEGELVLSSRTIKKLSGETNSPLNMFTLESVHDFQLGDIDVVRQESLDFFHKAIKLILFECLSWSIYWRSLY